MNYGELLVAVADELNAPDVSSATVGVKINLALKRAQRKHTFLAMEALATFSITEDLDSYSLATIAPRYKEAVKLWAEDSSGGRYFIQRLESLSRLKENPVYGTPNVVLDTTGTDISLFPQFYATDNDTLYFYPAPGADFTGNFIYGRYFADMSQATDTNYLSDNYPELAIYGASAEIVRMLEFPERIAIYEGLYNRTLDEAIQRDEYERNSNLDFVSHRLPDLGFGISRR